MRMTIANRLYIEDPTPEAYAWCAENLVLENPEYHKREQMGKWLGNTPKTISLYEKFGDMLWLPFGVVKRFMTAFPNTPYKASISPVRRFDYKSRINPYDYQEKAVKAVLEGKNGILVAGCGSGKTQCGLESIARIGGRALWLTHTQDLLHQSMDRAKAVLDAPFNSYGTITAGKVNLGTGLTFATVQTMSCIDISSYRDYWDVIVVDECAHCAGTPTKVTQFYRVLSGLTARYKIGLTATPHRADGLEKSMFALLGDTLHTITQEEIAVNTCSVQVRKIETGYVPDYDAVLLGDGTLDYMKLVNALVEDEQRFTTVCNILNGLDGTAIVLGNRVEYLKKLNDAYPGRSVCISGQGQSKAAKKERREALEKLASGELDIVFGTYLLAKEGLDCPSLRYVVFATPEKDPAIVQQSAGRVARKAEGKAVGTVIDPVDNFGMYRSWYKKRRAVYKKLGYTIKED